MRYAVLADIHGNLPALEAVLQAVDAERVDGFVVAGDLVGYGPFPNECVDVVRELGPVCVAGNHDLIAIGKLSDSRCVALARETLKWTKSVLREDVRDYLASLPSHAVAEPVVVAHGAIDDPQEYVTRPEQARRQFERMAQEWPDARVLVLGHTHRPKAFASPAVPVPVRGTGRVTFGDSVYLLNPGAVGQSRELLARARYMILDLEAGNAAFHAIPYNVAACRMALRRARLSPNAHHPRPTIARGLRKAARRFRR